jgi:hypothetical protein
MGKGEIARYYKFMSQADQRTFDRWLKANAIAGLILTIGIVAMAISGSKARDPAVADNTTSDCVAALCSETAR